MRIEGLENIKDLSYMFMRIEGFSAIYFYNIKDLSYMFMKVDRT